MINSAYIRPDLIWNNQGNLGVFVENGIPTLPYGRLIQEGVEEGCYFQYRSVLVRTPGNPSPLVQFKKFYYIPCFYQPPVSPSFDNLSNRVSYSQNSVSSYSSYTNDASSAPSRSMSAAAASFIPAVSAGEQPSKVPSRNDQAASSSAVAAAPASCMVSKGTSETLPQTSSSSLSSGIEMAKTAATVAKVIPATIDGPVTDDEEVGYVGGGSSTIILTSEVIEMVAQQVQEKPKAWASPERTLQSLSPLVATKRETSPRQDSQESKTISFVETAPLKPPFEERKNGKVTSRLPDHLGIGVSYPSLELCSAGKQHMLKRLQIFHSMCLFFEKNKSFFQEFEVLDETWGSIQYCPNSPHFDYKRQEFEYQNAHISVFPKILLVKKGDKGGEKFQLNDCPITYQHVDGRTVQTTMHHLLNVCDFAPRVINEIDCLAEINPNRFGARCCSRNLLNEIIHKNCSANEALENFIRFYERELLQIQERLEGETNPYARQCNGDNFAYLQQNSHPAHKCLRGMLEALRKKTVQRHQSSSSSTDPG